MIWHPFINPWTIYGPCPTYWTMDETICAVAKIFSPLPFGVPKQQISPILIDLVLCGLPMKNSEYLSRISFQFLFWHGHWPPSLVPLLPFLGPPFFVEQKVFRWMWSSFLRCSTYNKGFQKKDWFARHKGSSIRFFLGEPFGRTSILRPTLSCNVKQPEQRELED